MEENKATISYKDFEADIKARDEEVRTVHWIGQDIEIKRRLSLMEVLYFVENVVDVCYQEEDGVFIYKPEVQAYAIKHTLVSLYTNIDLSEEDDNDFSVYDFITKSDIIDVIMNNIDFEQYNEMIQAIASKIKFINEQNSAAIMSEVSTLNSAINELVPQIREFASPEGLEKLQSAMDALAVFNEDATVKKLAMEMVKNG